MMKRGGIQNNGIRMGEGVWGLGFLIFLRTKLECLEDFWDTLQFYFDDFGLK